jgi:hypothetical protein
MNIVAEEHGWITRRGDGGAPTAPPQDRWILFVASAILVLLGGAFAGLTIA